MTGAAYILREVPTHQAEWFDVDALIPNQYAVIQVSTGTGSYVHAFAPVQTIVQGTEAWNQIKQQFDLHCMINHLPPEQFSKLTETIRQYFAASADGQQIAADHSYLPCFGELKTEVYADDASETGLLVESNELALKEAAHPLPSSVLEALGNLSAGVTPPYPEALHLAKAWVGSLYSVIKTQKGTWIDPHLTVQDGGDVVFEWWQGQKSLSVFVSVDEAWFLQSAGSNSEQTEGDANTEEARQSIWQWLTQ